MYWHAVARTSPKSLENKAKCRDHRPAWPGLSHDAGGHPIRQPPVRKQSHLFQPGRSGNPAGKPPGTRSKAVAELDRLGADGAKQVLEAVLRAAQQGDMVAAGIILKRCWPESRGRPVRLELPPITTAAEVVIASGAVVAAVSEGRISPEEGQAVSGIIDMQRRAIETVELAARIEALERNSRPR